MEHINFSDAKARLSSILDRVETGETVTVVRHGKPVATIHPVAKPPEPVDWVKLYDEVKKMPMSKTDSVDLIREMRDSGY